MREMGTVDLLTRKDEIALAKRIEDGIRQSVDAIATCPLAIQEIITLADKVEAGDMRLTDLLVDFIDPDDAEEEPIPVSPGFSADADKKGDDKADDDEEEEVVDTGPDPEEAAARFARIRKGYASLGRAIEKHGIGAKQIARHQKKLAREFLEIKFVPRQIDHLSYMVRDVVEQVRKCEKKHC